MNIAAAQSGGPTCAINASLLGVFRQARKEPSIETVFGSLNGIEGILKDNIVNLSERIKTEEDMELLRQTPSTVLGSCRFKLPEYSTNAELYERIFSCFEKYQIGAFFYIGGNDSMDTVHKLSVYADKIGSNVKVIGIPKTIDNDLECTDHTPGFGSAAKYVAATTQEIIRDSSVYALDSVTIIEIMGRHAGWLTASTCVLRVNGEIAPHLIYLPENPFHVADFLNDVREVQKKHKAVIVAVSEGVKPDFEDHEDDGRRQILDGFGHVGQIAGVGKALERVVRSEIGCKVRSIELNVMQRCSSHISSLTDILEAEQIGAQGVKTALQGLTGQMMTFKRITDAPYKISIAPVDVEMTANKEKMFPRQWINDEKNNVKDEAINYFLPLIQGEQVIRMKNGLPIHFHL